MNTRPTGYSVTLSGWIASVHPNGAVTFERPNGERAFGLEAEDVEVLAGLLTMGAGLRSQAKRRRQRALYGEMYSAEPTP